MRVSTIGRLVAAIAAVLLLSSPALADEPPAEPPAGAEGTEAESGTEDAAKDGDDAAKEGESAAKPADAGSFAGDWKSDWGDVSIEVAGNKVTGKWHDGKAPGEFSGELDENGVLVYSWTQADASGKGSFRMTNGKLVGRWGYGNSENNGGDWTLWRGK